MIHSSPFGGFMGVDTAGVVFAGPLGKDAAAMIEGSSNGEEVCDHGDKAVAPQGVLGE